MDFIYLLSKFHISLFVEGSKCGADEQIAWAAIGAIVDGIGLNQGNSITTSLLTVK